MGVVAEENGRAEAKARPGSLAMYTNSPGGVGHLHLKSLFSVVPLPLTPSLHFFVFE